MAEAEEQEDQSSEVEGGGKGAKRLMVLWDPLVSPDWDRESHTKEALLRIKR